MESEQVIAISTLTLVASPSARAKGERTGIPIRKGEAHDEEIEINYAWRLLSALFATLDANAVCVLLLGIRSP